VRKAGTQVRITSQLIDASTGASVAHCFEGSFAEIFDLQDQVALGVVSAVTLKVEHAEIERAKRKPTLPPSYRQRKVLSAGRFLQIN
jgi:hypothetical protein